jgi:hypothetical protein
MASNPLYVTSDLDLEGEEVMPADQMDDTELLSIVSQHELNSLGYHGADNEITAEQERALNYYNGVMEDVPAMEGGSSVVDGTVALVVDNALAALLKPFVSSDETVRFAPRGPEDVEIAEQATEYINFIFNTDNPGFLILHDWFKDALLSKVGVVKAHWETFEEFKGEEIPLNDELTAQIVRMSPRYLGEEDGIAFVGEMVEDGRVKIENIPPEEFRITATARNIDEATYVAHVPSNITRSDLIELGFDPDIVESLPAYSSSGDDNTLRDARYDDENYHDARNDSFHSANDRMALRDEYVRVDYDGDGVAELRRIVRVENTILLNEEVEDHPFAALCPIPMPHKVFGHSLADRAMQEQRIGTVLWRQGLDNLYKSNNPRPIIGENGERTDGSTADSLEDNAPGAAILLRDISQFRYEAVPFFASNVFPMMELLDKKTEENTGVSRAGQGLDTDALRKGGQMTATEMSMIASGKNARTEMVARIFAETGVTRLFKIILSLVTKYQPRERVIRLRNQWVPVDPREWPEMDVTISVGLGIGEKSEQMSQAMTVLEVMQQLQESPYGSMVGAKEVYNAVKRLFTTAGVKNTDDFLIEPQDGEEQPQGPSEAEIEAQAELAKSQQKIAFQEREMMAKMELKAFEARLDFALQQAKTEQEAQLAYERLIAEYELKREKIYADADAKVKMSSFRPGGDLDK